MIGSVNSAGVNALQVNGGFEAYITGVAAYTADAHTLVGQGSVDTTGLGTYTSGNNTLATAGGGYIDGVADFTQGDGNISMTTDMPITSVLDVVEDDFTLVADFMNTLQVVHASAALSKHGGSSGITPHGSGNPLSRH